MTSKLPIILINFKTYIEATGQKALNLARICEKISSEFDLNITVAVQATDLRMIAGECNIPIFAQHVDPITPGSHTGHVLPEAVFQAGAKGTLINHAERKIKLLDIATVIKRMKEFGLETCVCAANPETSGAAATFIPTYVAFELPELIGTGISISKAEPEKVRKSVELITKNGPGVIPLCGAGVSSAEDVSAALKLGAKGVLLASAFTKAKDPEAILIEMAKAASNQ
ncbi:MAG: triose-phosphate isomerase [Candidatus Helarchaeales archaeon]